VQLVAYDWLVYVHHVTSTWHSESSRPGLFPVSFDVHSSNLVNVNIKNKPDFVHLSPGSNLS